MGMPGISLVFDFGGGPGPSVESWQQALEQTRCDGPSRQQMLFKDDCFRIGVSIYDGYPIQTRENDLAFVCLEGLVYGASQDRLMDRLLEIGGSPCDLQDPLDGLRPLLRDQDGEYVAVVYAKQARRLWISVDALGRLPLYAWQSPQTLVVTRDQRFVVELAGTRTVDRIAIAHLLLFGFPLGRETLLQGVERVTPGHDFAADANGVRQRSAVLGELNLEHKDHADRSLQQNVEELGELLVRSCRVRSEAAESQLLGLSGGIDSRAVGAAMIRAAIPFSAATFLDSGGVYQKEIAVAQEVAQRLGAPWRLFTTPPPPGSSLHRMLQMKLGLNTLGEAYSIDLFEMLRSAYGSRVAYWSGDGGDKLLPDQRPRLPGHGRGAIARYIIDKNRIWDLDQVSRLTGVSVPEIFASVEAIVEGYPELTASMKYVRFVLAERAFRWISEGEDTNRHYYWTVSPFYSQPLFRAAMGCPDHQKSGYALYRSLLRHLMPAITEVADANLGMPMSSPFYVWYRRARELSRRLPRLQQLLRRGRMVSPLQPRSERILDLIRSQARASASVRACFSPAAIEAIVATPAHSTPYALECLLTATSAVEQITDGRSTLRDSADVRFG
jgi:asparagine synthase (glutamine-hydrolysing)